LLVFESHRFMNSLADNFVQVNRMVFKELRKSVLVMLIGK